MKKHPFVSLLVLLLLITPFAAVHASPVTWDAANSILQPLQALWTYTVQATNFTATSTSAANTFPHASTTQLTVSSTEWLTALATPAGTVLAVDPNGKIIATTTASAGVSAVTGLYPVLSSGGLTPAISLAFGTTTSNTWAGTQTFTNSPVLGSLSGVIYGNAGTLATKATSSATINAPLSGTLTTLGAGDALSLGTVGTANGGTASTTALGGILVGNGTSAVKSLAIGSGLSFDGTTLSTSGAGITNLGPAGQLQSGGTQTLASSTSSFNGLTAGIIITGSGNTQTFQPTLSGTLGIGGGGTGQGTFTSSQLLYGNGTAALSSVATSAPSVTYPVQYSGTLGSFVGGTGGAFSLAFGTTSSNTWGGTQTFSNPLIDGTLTGLIGGNNGTTYALATSTNFVTAIGPTGQTTTGAVIQSTTTAAYQGLTVALQIVGSAQSLQYNPTLSGTLLVGGGGTGFSSITDGQLVMGAGSGTALSKLATSTIGSILQIDNSTGRPSWVATSTLKIALSDTTGTLAVNRGGTGQATFTSSQLLYGNSTAALTSVATTTFAASAEFSYSGTLGALVGGANGTLSLASNGVALTKLNTIAANSILGNLTGATANVTAFATTSIFTWSSGFSQGANSVQLVEHRSFTYATSTWTGTTTIPVEIGYGEVWNSIQCYTDVGTVNVQIGIGTASTTLLNASTTIGTFAYSSNNTMTAGSRVKVDLGTPASSPTKITCTEKDTN